MEPGSSLWCQAIGQEAMGRNRTQGKRLQYVGDQALEQSVQKGGGFSLTGDNQEPSRCNPVPCALG